MNAPDRFELFLLGDGETKVSMEQDTRQPNAAIFTFNKEDHTLGNLLRATLIHNEHVIFSAYKVPHPLFPKFELRIQTDEETTPKEALLAACQSLIGDLQMLSQKLTREWELNKIARDTS
ncbi:DNA-directed RNA polymerase [Tuber borchii]|uniref:DNA-directed RNA polymerase n=1 Tax=Tuber borchii TaxID=42251 RepID=A0A2T6ZXG9_TUBBO|nr:DNA-directed RNA polymerase [Tuber borchii]